MHSEVLSAFRQFQVFAIWAWNGGVLYSRASSNHFRATFPGLLSLIQLLLALYFVALFPISFRQYFNNCPVMNKTLP